METNLSSATKTVVIGPGVPTRIIGERINPTGRKALAAEMAEGNLQRVADDALAQVEAGATILVKWPRCPSKAFIDSSVVDALARGLEVYEGKALVNSVNGEEERLEAVLPLVKKHGAAVIGLAMDEAGIPETPEKRFQVAKKILERAQDHGIDVADVVIDPLVLPVGASPKAGRLVLDTLRMVTEGLGVNTVCGASNISFGLPDRPGLNAAFLAMTVASGITAVIANPLEAIAHKGVLAGDALMGKDEHCMNWIIAHRKLAAEG